MRNLIELTSMLLIIIFSHCNSSELLQNAQREFCQKRIKFLKQNVYLKDTTSLIYGLRDDSLSQAIALNIYFNDQKCLYGYSKKEIKNMIGNPSVDYNHLNGKNVWRYYMLSDSCRDAKNCYCWEITFGNENRVKNFREFTINPDPIYRN